MFLQKLSISVMCLSLGAVAVGDTLTKEQMGQIVREDSVRVAVFQSLLGAQGKERHSPVCVALEKYEYGATDVVVGALDPDRSRVILPLRALGINVKPVSVCLEGMRVYFVGSIRWTSAEEAEVCAGLMGTHPVASQEARSGERFHVRRAGKGWDVTRVTGTTANWPEAQGLIDCGGLFRSCARGRDDGSVIGVLAHWLSDRRQHPEAIRLTWRDVSRDSAGRAVWSGAHRRALGAILGRAVTRRASGLSSAGWLARQTGLNRAHPQAGGEIEEG